MTEETQPDPIQYNEETPLEKIPGETQRANLALFDYYSLGPGRSMQTLLNRYKEDIAKGLKPPTRRFSTLLDWSRFNGWQERVAAQERIDRAKIQARWLERQDAIREADYLQGEKIRQLADDALSQAPAFLKQKRRVIKGQKGKEGEADEPDQIIITMAIDAKLIVQAAKTASDLQRRAAGLGDETTINHQGEVATYPITLQEFKKRQQSRRAQVEADLEDFESGTDE